MDLPKYVKALKELLELMKNHDLAEVELEEDGQKVRLRKSEPHVSAAPIAIQGSVPGSQPGRFQFATARCARKLKTSS